MLASKHQETPKYFSRRQLDLKYFGIPFLGYDVPFPHDVGPLAIGMTRVDFFIFLVTYRLSRGVRGCHRPRGGVVQRCKGAAHGLRSIALQLAAPQIEEHPMVRRGSFFTVQ